MSPILFKSAGNTTAVKGHAVVSSQKVRKVIPFSLVLTCVTVPLMQCSEPICKRASAAAKHGGRSLRAAAHGTTKARTAKRENQPNRVTSTPVVN